LGIKGVIIGIHGQYKFPGVRPKNFIDKPGHHPTDHSNRRTNSLFKEKRPADSPQTFIFQVHKTEDKPKARSAKKTIHHQGYNLILRLKYI
jgi:hypothetical protein